jgi:peptidoglycan/LPS O-acetylase OafA/YrhL
MLSRILNHIVPPTSGQRFASLDGLRAFAVLGVAVSHLPAVIGYPPIAVPWFIAGYFDRAGYLAVTVFFVLTAFLLYFPWAKPDGKPRDVPYYYKRRAWRIMPAYLAALAFGLLAVRLVGIPVEKWDIVAHVFFVHTWHPVWSNTIVTPAWSLPAEIQFYLLLPLLALLLAGRSVGWLLGVAAVGAGVQFFSERVPYDQWVLWNNWPCLALPFIFGLAAGWAVAYQGRRNWLRWLAPIGLVLMFAFSVAYTWPERHWQYTTRWSELFFNARGLTMSLVTALAIVGLAVGDRDCCARVLAWRPLRVVGICGYGVFLFHYPIYLLLSRFSSQWTGFLAGLPLAILAGVLSFLYLEAPAIQRSRKKVPMLLPNK